MNTKILRWSAIVIVILAAFADNAVCDGSNDEFFPPAEQYRSSGKFRMALEAGGYISLVGLTLLSLLVGPSFVSYVLAKGGLGAMRAYEENKFLGMDKTSLLTSVTVIHEAWQKFDLDDIQCRKRFICEMHVLNSNLGNYSKAAFEVIDSISGVASNHMHNKMQHLLKEYKESMRHGEETKNCHKYNDCPYSFAKQIMATIFPQD